MKAFDDYADLWLKSSPMKKAGKDNLKHLKRALKELLECLGFSTLVLKPREFYQLLSQLTLDQFFEAVKARLLTDEVRERQVASGVNGEFWIEGICNLYDRSIAAKNSETTKNPKIALRKFLSFLVQQSEWQLLCPLDVPEIRPRSHGKALPRVYPERVHERYGLSRQEWTPKLRDELAILTKFWLDGGEEAWEELLEAREVANLPLGRKPKVERSQLETIEKMIPHASLYFGWQMTYLQISKEDLSFKSLTNPAILRQYRGWQRKRDRSHAMVLNLIKIGLVVAKQENFAITERRNWEDIREILDLRDLQAEFVEKYSAEQKKSEEQKKPLREATHFQLEEISAYLLQRCASFTECTDSSTEKTYKYRRPESAIIWDRLIYTVCTVMFFAPVRQQQIRTAAEGESLLRRLDGNGSLAYVLYSRKHKLERYTARRQYI